MLAQAVAVGGAAAILHAAQSFDAAPALTASHIYPAFLIIGALSFVSLFWFMRMPPDAGASLRRARRTPENTTP
jgi:predicted benzoate:H+ symporter BenE